MLTRTRNVQNILQGQKFEKAQTYRIKIDQNKKNMNLHEPKTHLSQIEI